MLGLGILLLALAQTVAITVDGLRDDVSPADLAVVLGSKVYPDGTPSPSLTARLERAIELYRDGTVPRILVSGGQGAEGWDEAQVMKRYLVEHGIPAGSIHEDAQGLDTYQTARFTRDFMRAQQLDSVILVTQFFHVPRTRIALQRMGIPSIGEAHARYHTWRDIWSLAREIPALYYYVLRSYPGEDASTSGPAP